MPTDAAAQLHANSLIAVTHDHRSIVSDLPRMKAGGVTSKIYQLTVDVDVEAGYHASKDRPDQWLRQAIESLDAALTDIAAHPDACILARTAADARRAKREGKVAIFLGTEGTRWLEGSLAPLRMFHRMGLRELQLVWAFHNQVVPRDGKLSDFGREVVKECNRLGIILDMTHISDAAFFECAKLTQAPIIISHGSAAGATVDQTDDRLRALAATGGLIGIHFYTSYLGPDPLPCGVVKQVDYIAKLIGIDHVALGVDFFPTDGAWQKFQADQGAMKLQWAVDDMSGMPKITAALLDHGFSETDVRKVLGENFLRVLERVTGS